MGGPFNSTEEVGDASTWEPKSPLLRQHLGYGSEDEFSSETIIREMIGYYEDRYTNRVEVVVTLGEKDKEMLGRSVKIIVGLFAGGMFILGVFLLGILWAVGG